MADQPQAPVLPAQSYYQLTQVRVPLDEAADAFAIRDASGRTPHCHATPALEPHLLHALKVSQKSSVRRDSLAYREMCQADGPITIYIQVPTSCENVFCELFRAIGYWGQGNSPAFCNTISNSRPNKNECARPLTSLTSSLPLGHFFVCIVSEFCKPDVAWEEIIPDRDDSKNDPLKRELYIWPMLVIEQQSKHKLLQRCSLYESVDFC